MNSIAIREIQPKDSMPIAFLIQSVLEEFDAPKTGTAYADPELSSLYEAFKNPGFVYFVLERDAEIVGGAGIAPLQKGESGICELQKMYLSPSVRGLGFGNMLIGKCLELAKEMKYSKCYLETLPNMLQATQLYRKWGFEALPGPLGTTNHTACSVWMIKDLNAE